MTSTSVQASAPGKVILFGEHAVVYGQPAIAVPVTEVEAVATIETAPPQSGLTVIAADLGRSFSLTEAATNAPLVVAARLTLKYLEAPTPDAKLTVHSTIPIASGLGSGAAVSTALVRALSAFSGAPLSPSEVSDLVFEVEKIHHGTPSGIDNTVIAHNRPVYFQRKGSPALELLSVRRPFRLLIADTGRSSPTKRLVNRVRVGWQRNTERHEMLFERIGSIARSARHCIEEGDPEALGPLMDENHALLRDLGVSSRKLDELTAVARGAGALGAKLSGAGQGGNIVALIEGKGVGEVKEALRQAGAVRLIDTIVT